MSVLNESFPNGRFAVIDLETTGLSPAVDRIVEVSVFHVDGPNQVRHVLDTLVNPRRRVSGTEVHGITDDDVQLAPTFADVAPLIASALSGRVMVAHNVYFDARFLSNELQLSGLPGEFPHVCTMYLAPMLDAGEKRSLDDACREHGISRDRAHCAADDARASSQLLLRLLTRSSELGVSTYGDLAKRKKYKFVESFGLTPMDVPEPSPRPNLLSRSSSPPTPVRGTVGPPPMDPEAEHRHWVRRYYDVLVTAIADLELTDAEANALQQIARQGNFRPSEIRAAHGRVYAAFINQYLNDALIDEEEQWVLANVWASLKRLGWAPGQ